MLQVQLLPTHSLSQGRARPLAKLNGAAPTALHRLALHRLQEEDRTGLDEVRDELLETQAELDVSRMEEERLRQAVVELEQKLEMVRPIQHQQRPLHPHVGTATIDSSEAVRRYWMKAAGKEPT